MPDLSISDIVPRVRDLLYDTPWETTSTTTTTSTTVAVPDGTLWETGAIGEWQTGTVGFEQFLVASVAANNLTVTRGYNGTTAETHSSGDRVLRDPLFSGRQIQKAVTTSVNKLWPSVYLAVAATAITPSTTAIWYDIVSTGTVVGIIKVSQLYGSSSQYQGIFGVRGGRPYVVDYNISTSLAASGRGIKFPSGFFHATNTVATLTQQLVTGTTDIKDNGQFPVADCLVWTAAGILVEAAEIKRVSQGAAMDQQTTVNPGARLQTGNFYAGTGKQMLENLRIRYETFFQPGHPWVR